MLKKMKDAALSKGAKIAINNQIKEYGKMLKLNLDSEKKSIEMEVMLEGEKEPLTVNVQKYEMTQQGDKHFLKIQGVKTSRAWINTVASSYLEGKTFEIPAEYAKMLKVVI
jgi:metal-dependent hydrolase (beta-lactamase superfamily II)